jgi:hypothetical protein
MKVSLKVLTHDKYLTQKNEKHDTNNCNQKKLATDHYSKVSQLNNLKSTLAVKFLRE